MWISNSELKRANRKIVALEITVARQDAELARYKNIRPNDVVVAGEPVPWDDYCNMLLQACQYEEDSQNLRSRLERTIRECKEIIGRIAEPSSGVNFGDNYLGLVRQYELHARDALTVLEELKQSE